MSNRSGGWIILIVLLLIDLYVFQAVKYLSSGASGRSKNIISGVYWFLSFSSVLFLLYLPYWSFETYPKIIRNYIFAIFVGLFIAKLLAGCFFMIDDVRRGGTWVISKFFPKNMDETNGGWNLSRSAFLSWLGIGIGGSVFSSLLYGFSNKYNYQVRNVKLNFANLPAGFRGLRIVHISDIHAGSFTDKLEVLRGVEMIMKENADLVLFTGDLVNDHADEMAEYKEVFKKVSAPMGVFSTLGNHDYGDYIQWNSPEEKIKNLENLKDIHHQMGWKLLMNEHVVLERNGDKIALIGIENWGAKGRFPKYGKLEKAYEGAHDHSFKILLSHDPSHWDAEVKPKYPGIDLMLSGHTHGMQFGLETPFMKWSPVQLMYRQWAGLYADGNQRLYVNRGFGYIGYPGRVGIMPEITVIELA